LSRLQGGSAAGRIKSIDNPEIKFGVKPMTYQFVAKRKSYFFSGITLCISFKAINISEERSASIFSNKPA
jgi:hypothetical protein